MDKLKQKLIKEKSESLETDKRIVKKQFIIGSILATLIAGSPFLFYLYNYVPASPVWETYFFTYRSGWYLDAQTAMWMLTGKVVTLIFLIIWFFTCRHWWYHSLLVPISMYVYQIIDSIRQDITMDEFNFLYILPVMALIIPSIYLIRAKVFDKINDADKTMQELEDEFKIKPKGFLNTLSNYF